MQHDPSQRTGAAAVQATLRQMYGTDLGGHAGIVHVAAVWQAAPGRYLTLAIGAHTPRSPYDRLVLEVARARADAILTTGRILRAEPALTHDLQGPWAAGLAAWRRHVLGKPAPPLVLVLTSGHDVPFQHPVFRARARPIVLTTRAAADALVAARPDARTAVVGVARPDVRGAIDYLERVHGCRTVTIEAGPSTARQLYQPPARVDELMLSVLHAEQVPVSARGPEFVSAADIDRVLPRRVLPRRVLPRRVLPGRALPRQGLPRSGAPWQSAEPAGLWRFHRFTRG